jgi:hypothetical protein
MAVMLTFAFAIAVVISESNPTLFAMEKLISFTFLAFAITTPSFLLSPN